MTVKNIVFESNEEEIALENLIVKGLKSKFKSSRNHRLYARDTYCTRRNVILADYEETVETDGLFSFYTEIGNTVESIIIRSLKKEAVLVDANYAIETDLNVGGKIDAIIYKDNKFRVLEIKTASKNPDYPKDSHLRQAQTYAACTGFDYSVVYLPRSLHKFVNDKMALDLRIFNYDFDIDTLKAHMFEVAKSHFFLEKNLLPPMNKKYKYQCEYCQFLEFCWNKKAITHSLKAPTIKQEQKIIDLAEAYVNKYFDPTEIENRRELSKNKIVKRKKVDGFDYSKII